MTQKEAISTPADWADCQRWAETLLADTAITRRSFESLYNAFLASRDPKTRAALKSNFLHAIATTRPEGQAAGGLKLGDDRIALAQALLGFGTRETMLKFAQHSLAPQLVAKLLPAAASLDPKDKVADGDQDVGFAEITDEDPLKLAAQLESLAAASGQPVGVPVGAATWTWSATLLSALGLANRRVAKVIVSWANAKGKKKIKSTGTGFLVGPSSLLTNWHVLDPAFDIQNGAVLKKGFSVEIQFDNQTIAKTAPGNCLIYHSPVGALEPASGEIAEESKWWSQDSAFENWAGQNQAALDCAVIKIEPAIGLQRGWYDLSEVPAPKSGRCWFIHYPNGIARAVSVGDISKFTASRLIHSSSSATGSSGGLVLNPAGHPVGLHHAGFGDGLFRAAVPLKTIFSNLQSQPLAQMRLKEVGVPYVQSGTLPDGTPVLARGDLLRAFGDAIDRNASVFFIAPDTSTQQRLGRTFCGRVLEAATIPGAHLWRRFTPGELPSHPRAFVESILKDIGRAEETQLPPQETADSAYALRLAQFLCKEVRDCAFSVWIVLDDLDRLAIADTAIRVFLGHLYREAPSFGKLRFVLIGVQQRVLTGLGLIGTDSTSLPNANQAAYRTFQLLPIDTSHYEKALSDWVAEKVGPKRTWQADAYDTLGRICAANAQGTDPLRDVSYFVKERISGYLSPTKNAL